MKWVNQREDKQSNCRPSGLRTVSVLLMWRRDLRLIIINTVFSWCAEGFETSCGVEIKKIDSSRERKMRERFWRLKKGCKESFIMNSTPTHLNPRPFGFLICGRAGAWLNCLYVNPFVFHFYAHLGKVYVCCAISRAYYRHTATPWAQGWWLQCNPLFA